MKKYTKQELDILTRHSKISLAEEVLDFNSKDDCFNIIDLLNDMLYTAIDAKIDGMYLMERKDVGYLTCVVMRIASLLVRAEVAGNNIREYSQNVED